LAITAFKILRIPFRVYQVYIEGIDLLTLPMSGRGQCWPWSCLTELWFNIWSV